MDFVKLLPRQHIQNISAASTVQPHWGYADRVVPCTNDAGSCTYLDIVYGAHDIGMYYTGILWATIGGILIVWAIGRRFLSEDPSGLQLPPRVFTEDSPSTRPPAVQRCLAAFSASSRRILLPDASKFIFGRVTRAQVLTLLVLTGYLTIWSFVGITYGIWITPVKNSPGLYNTRTSLGPWSDRVGVLAYALTPLSILLSSRESILSLVTGLPYQSFNFLHRWLGYIIFLQSALHTIGWSIIEIRLYQPQPSTGLNWIRQTYMIWGLVAMILLTILVCLSTPWGIRLTGYEAFRKLHYVLAMVYIGACWGHWEQLKVFLIPGLIVWLLDRAARLVRTSLLHYGYLPSGHMGVRPAVANVSLIRDSINGDVVRLDFNHPHDSWSVGQHFYLTFPESSLWQSHPFTPVSRPVPDATTQEHSYIFRAKSGETRKVAELCARRFSRESQAQDSQGGLLGGARLSVILTGPYGEDITRNLSQNSNILCLAGGTGITFVLPVLLDIVSRPPVPDRKISLVWAVRHLRDIDWASEELATLRQRFDGFQIEIHIYVTRSAEDLAEASPTITTTKDFNGKSCCHVRPTTDSATAGSSTASSTPGSISEKAIRTDSRQNRIQGRPDLQAVVGDFTASTVRGRTDVFVSGPCEMTSDMRKAVATVNDGKKVWNGEERYDVRLTTDNRLEW
ncbi:Ferric reductase like transmembrane component-containing protein 9 [Elsinoe fawcettii]|nr:Ferric reductase like transmembrane component-containing protein 9 [Elsinoe fawcettii]